MYTDDCKLKGHCNSNCNVADSCKLLVIRKDEGVVKIKRLSNNAKIPVRGTSEALGYDLATA